MIEPSEIDHLKHLYRLPIDCRVTHISRNLSGKLVFLEAKNFSYRLQFYDTMHSKRQIENDLELLRSLSNLELEVSIPLIDRHGNVVDHTIFQKPIVLFSSNKKGFHSLDIDNIDLFSRKIPSIEQKLNQEKSISKGKKMDALFTMFELVAHEELLVDALLKSEYYAFKASFIDLMNQFASTSYALLPGNDHFFVTDLGFLGFSHTNFIFDLPPLFALSQLILNTCFLENHELDFNKLDAATYGYSKSASLEAEVWDHFDQILKTCAFFEFLSHWMTSIYHPHLIAIDQLIESRQKQKYLKKLTLKEIG